MKLRLEGEWLITSALGSLPCKYGWKYLENTNPDIRVPLEHRLLQSCQAVLKSDAQDGPEYIPNNIDGDYVPDA